VVDPWGQVKAGFEITGALNRSEFGLTWNATTEDGSIVLDEVIKLALNVQVIKQV
jgi:polyisoprenoid-binding protein YceI